MRRFDFMRLTYAGHSTVLIELDGLRILTDPLLRRRFLHVKRRVAPVDPALARSIDVVTISHAQVRILAPGEVTAVE